MITKEQLAAAEKHFPMPGFVTWYLTKFPKRIFIIIGVIMFFAGFFMTVFMASHNLTGIPTVIFCTLVLTGGTLHTIAWYEKRSTYRKRARFLGVSFHEYNNAL